MWFRGLVAVTCVAVLAAIGFFVWQDRHDRAAIASEQAFAERAALASECRQMLDDMAAGRDDDLTVGHLLVCVNGQHFTIADIRSRGLNPIADQVEDHIAEFGAD